jgi:hypothetical protein
LPAVAVIPRVDGIWAPEACVEGATVGTSYPEAGATVRPPAGVGQTPVLGPRGSKISCGACREFIWTKRPNKKTEENATKTGVNGEIKQKTKKIKQAKDGTMRGGLIGRFLVLCLSTKLKLHTEGFKNNANLALFDLSFVHN